MDRQEMFEKAGIEFKEAGYAQPQPAPTQVRHFAPIPVPQQQPLQHQQHEGQCFITINGKGYRLAFTMMQMQIFAKEMVKYEMDMEKAACIPYSAILMAARQDKMPVDITFEDVLLWYDEAVTNDTAEYKAYDAAYKASNYYKRFVQPIEEEQEKKRTLIQMKQEPLPREY